MPFTVLVVLVAIVVGYARGGRLRRIADADLSSGWLLLVGLGLQVAVDVLAARGADLGGAGTALLLTSQTLVVVWIWRNRFRPGMPLVLVGLVLNAAVIAANGAMPVDPDAIAAIGLGGLEPLPGKHELLTDATRLPWLADVLALPPLRTIISVGDIVLAAGLLPLLHHLMTFRPPVERRGGPRRAVSAPAPAPEPGRDPAPRRPADRARRG